MSINDEIIKLDKKINQMLSDLEYDKGEMSRLRFEIEYALDIDLIENNDKTLIDRLVQLSMLSAKKSSIRFRKRKFKHIRNAMQLNDDKYLLNAVYNNTSIFELRQITADSRYYIKNLLDTPGSNLAVGTIIDSYNLMEEQWKDLKDITNEIKDYLNKKYITNISI